MIDWAHFKPERSKCWSIFDIDRDSISGTGAWKAGHAHLTALLCFSCRETVCFARAWFQQMAQQQCSGCRITSMACFEHFSKLVWIITRKDINNSIIVNASTDTAFRGRQDCIETGGVIHKTSPVRIRRVELGGYLFGYPEWFHQLAPPAAHSEFVAWWVLIVQLA